MRPYVDLFFMGAAFLLLETSNVVRFALLFGTTWFVNALVFAGILASVFLAIEVARRVRFRAPRSSTSRCSRPWPSRGRSRPGRSWAWIRFPGSARRSPWGSARCSSRTSCSPIGSAT